jgi:hypothetical protein
MRLLIVRCIAEIVDERSRTVDKGPCALSCGVRNEALPCAADDRARYGQRAPIRLSGGG